MSNKKKKNDLFNPAFESLKKIVKEGKSKEPIKRIEKRPERAEKPLIDYDLFKIAMSGVTPVSTKRGKRWRLQAKPKELLTRYLMEMRRLLPICRALLPDQ
jgi:hypothetical protein